jgi:hypothetical protein
MLQLRGRGTGAMMKHPFGDDKKTATDPNGFIDEYLQKELKLGLYKAQQTSLVKALTKPEEWLDSRDLAMKTISAKLAPTYWDAIEKYKKLYPMDEAVELANQDIKAFFDVKIRHLEIEQPGASLLFQGAVLNNNMDKIKASALISGSLGKSSNISKDEFKKYYKEKRARMKAKRSKKSEGQ